MVASPHFDIYLYPVSFDFIMHPNEDSRTYNIAVDHDTGLRTHPWYLHGKFQPHDFMIQMINTFSIRYINGRPTAYFHDKYVSGRNALVGIISYMDAGLSLSQRNDVVNRLLNYLNLISPHFPESPPNLIRFQNTVLDINTMTVSEPNVDTIILNIIPHAYNPHAYNHDVDLMLDNITCNNRDMRTLLEEMVGYCLLRTLKLRKFFILTGGKRNGKSTFLDFLNYVIGKDNVSNLSIQDYQVQFSRVRLYGMLANIGDDISDIYMREVDLLKKIVSGESIQAAEKNEPVFFFRPYATSIFSANDIPRVNDPTGAVMDRMIVIPFDAYFDESTADYGLADRLATEGAAEYMIRLGVSAIKKAMDRGHFTEPSSVKEAKEETQRANDHISDWLAEINPRGRNRDDVYDDYICYCNENGIGSQSRMSRKGLVRRINNRLNLTVRKISATSFIFDERTLDLKSSLPPRPEQIIIMYGGTVANAAHELWKNLEMGTEVNPKHVKVGNLTYEMILDILLGKGIIYETGVRKYAYAGAPE